MPICPSGSVRRISSKMNSGIVTPGTSELM